MMKKQEARSGGLPTFSGACPVDGPANGQELSAYAQLPEEHRCNGAPECTRPVDFLRSGNLLKFMLWLMPLYMSCGIAAFQHTLADGLEAALLPAGHALGILPREHGKTTVGVVGLLTLNACRCAASYEVQGVKSKLQEEEGRQGAAAGGRPPGPCPWNRESAFPEPKWHIQLIGATQAKAEEALALVKHELATNELIQRYFPSAARPARDNRGRTEAYRKSEIILECGLRIVAVGARNPIRGALFRGRRPDLILLDDAEDDRSANSQKLRDKTCAWFSRAVLPALDNALGSLVWLGTLLHHDSALARLLEEWGESRQLAAGSGQQEESACTACIEPGSMSGASSVEAHGCASQPTGQQDAASCLAASAAHSSTSLPAVSCQPPARAEDENHLRWRVIFLPAINEDGTPLWPERWPLEKLERRRWEIGDAAFNQEYLLRPVSAEAQRFRPGEFGQYDPAELQYKDGDWHIDGCKLETVIGVDPAVAEGEHNDYFCAAVVGFCETAEDEGRADLSVTSNQLSVISDQSGPKAQGPRRKAQGEERSGSPLITDHCSLITFPSGAEETPQIKSGMRAYVLEIVRIKDRFQRQQEILLELNRRWKPRVVGIEKTAYQKVLCQVCAAHGLPVQELNAGGPKAYRIEALSGNVAQGCWRLPVQASWNQALYDEAYSYPCARHDDQLDALARAQEVGTKLLDNWRRRSSRGALPEMAYAVSGVRAG